MDKNSVGIVETQYFTFAKSPNEMVLDSGDTLGPITLAYETYGELNENKSNAIYICHALSGDAHAAGYHQGDKKPGWWDIMIGPGKAFDTNKFFLICSNVIGGCSGSTGPSSINPKTKKPYALDFPAITIKDMVTAQKRLIDHLGIKKLFAVAGGSMGGQQAVKWTVQYPDFIRAAIVIATTTRHTAQQIALHVVGRQAIMSDPAWNNGNYYGKKTPEQGLALARMIGHISYMSDQSMGEKFGRKLRKKENVSYNFSTNFEVESYLRHQGDSFVQRFDANSYLYITRALDYFDLTKDGKLADAFTNVKSKFLLIAFTSDWLYPTYQAKEMVKALKINDIDVSYIEVDSSYGHDAFLIENEGQARLISNYLNRIQKESIDES